MMENGTRGVIRISLVYNLNLFVFFPLFCLFIKNLLSTIEKELELLICDL